MWLKKSVDELVEECIENIDENEMIYNGALNDHKNVCGSCERSSCTLRIVLFVIAFLIINSISSACVYFHWCSKKVLFVLNLIPTLKHKFHWNINGKYQRNKHFFNYMINIEGSIQTY